MGSKNIYECIPQNDLDCYYNSNWKKTHSALHNITSSNNFVTIQNYIDNEMYKFITNARTGKNKILNNLVRFRESYYDRKDDSQLFRELVVLINNITNISELANAIKIMHNLNISTLFTLGVSPNFKKQIIGGKSHDNAGIKTYALSVGEISLTLESKEMYDSASDILIKNYNQALTDVYYFVTRQWNYSISNMTTFIRNVIIFEILFSKSNLSISDLADTKITHNCLSYQFFIEKFDIGDFWKIIFGEYMQDDMIIFYQNETALIFIKYFLKKMTSKELTMTKDYLVFCLIKKFGLYTSIASSFDELRSQPLDDKKLFIETFYETFGYYLESIYETKYSNIDDKKQIYEMFTNMKSYCFDVFNTSDFYNDKTKIEAINKLNSLDMIVGKQNYHIDLLELPCLTNNFYDNLFKLNSFFFKKMIDLIGKPVNRYNLSINNDIFSFVVNAYYDPYYNIIYIPSSMINELFFKTDIDPIYNYGSLGCIIGHEFMHCFDSNGCLFDHNGYLQNWWTTRDYEKFNKEIEKVKNHYATLSLFGTKINSDLSISENIADIAGLKLSLRTYIKKYMPCTNLQYLSPSDKNHLKKFFQRWAQTLRTIESDDVIKSSMNFDVHSPNIIRINAPFSHINEYYKVFDVNPQHQNYLEPCLRTTFLDIF